MATCVNEESFTIEDEEFTALEAERRFQILMQLPQELLHRDARSDCIEATLEPLQAQGRPR